MTKFLVVTILIIFSPFISVRAQNTSKIQVDARLRTVFDDNYIQNIQNDTFWIKKWQFYLDNSFFISDASTDKSGNESIEGMIEVADVNHINILALEKTYALKRDYYTYKAYKIKNTSQYLVYFPTRDYIEKLNNYLVNSKL